MKMRKAIVEGEEYPFIGFGISWLIGKYLASGWGKDADVPEIMVIDETPSIADWESDLVYWWHQHFESYSELENRARISLIRRSREDASFDLAILREVLGRELDKECQVHAPWKLRISRMGTDLQSRQAVGTFHLLTPNPWLDFAYLLVMTRSEKGEITVIGEHSQVRCGR